MFETTQDVLKQLGQFSLIGFFLGFLYDLFRIFRILIKHPKALVNIEDFVFMPTAAFILFCFSVEIGTGAFRLYYLLSALFGAAVYRFTLGWLTVFAARLIRRVLFIFFKAMNGVLLKPIKRIFYLIRQKTSPIFVAFCQKSKKFLEKTQMLLKKRRDIVYNNINNTAEAGKEERNVIKAKVRKKA